MSSLRALRHAVYFALYPDDGVAEAARRLALEQGLKPVRRQHVSLVGLSGGGDGPPQQGWIGRALDAGGGVRRPPFLIELNTLSTFNTTRNSLWPIVLRGEDGVIGLTMLSDALRAALAREGLGGWASQTPHLTISWSRRQIAERPVPPLRWTARELVLIHSLQGAGRHQVLGRWPLEGETADASDLVGGGN